MQWDRSEGGFGEGEVKSTKRASRDTAVVLQQQQEDVVEAKRLDHNVRSALGTMYKRRKLELLEELQITEADEWYLNTQKLHKHFQNEDNFWALVLSRKNAGIEMWKVTW